MLGGCGLPAALPAATCDSNSGPRGCPIQVLEECPIQVLEGAQFRS